VKQRFALLLVEWEDAYSGNHDWFKLDTMPDAVDPLVAHTTGFLLREDDERLTLAQSFTHDSAANLWTIPKGMILNRTHIRWVTVERGDDVD
jgi:hypothetical protein